MRINPMLGGGATSAAGSERGAADAAVSVPANASGASAASADPLRPAAGARAGEQAVVTLTDLARMLGLPDDQAWRAVLAALVRDAMPLTRALAERALALWRRSGLPEPEAAALIWLNRHDLAPLPERVALLKAFRRAHPDRSGPPADALMVAAHIARKDAPLRLHVWSAAPDDQPSRSPASGQPDEATPEAFATSADARGAAALEGQPVVVLLTVETARLGQTEALIELQNDVVTVTYFNQRADAAAALAAGLDCLRDALAAAGLTPTSLAALNAAPGLDEERRLRRIDARI